MSHFPFDSNQFDAISRSKQIHVNSDLTNVFENAIKGLKSAGKSMASLKAVKLVNEPNESFENRSNEFYSATNESINGLDKLFKKILDSQANHTRIRDSCEDVIRMERDKHYEACEKMELDSSATINNFDFPSLVATDYEMSIAKYFDSKQRVKYGSDPNYLEFREAIWNAQENDDDMPNINKYFSDYDSDEEDFVEEQVKESYKCPLTKQFYEDPVTSKICHHSFSRKAIMEVLASHGNRMKCPIPACAHFLEQNGFERNAILEMKTQRAKQKEHLDIAAQNEGIDKL